jgi:glutamate synthase domain-containing protein 1
VLRVKLADANTPRELEFEDTLRRHRNEVEQRLRAAGARIKAIEDINEYTLAVTLSFDGELKTLADHVESVPDAEVLSAGHALEIVKDLGDARTVADGYQLDSYLGSHGIGHVRMATESDVDIANAHPPVAPPARALGPPIRVRVRLGDHRRVPGAEAAVGLLA